jgi:hypothetical protein
MWSSASWGTLLSGVCACLGWLLLLGIHCGVWPVRLEPSAQWLLASLFVVGTTLGILGITRGDGCWALLGFTGSLFLGWPLFSQLLPWLWPAR